MGTPADRIAVGLRIPRDLHSWLTETAERDERSLNGQIVWLLQQARAADPEQPVAAPPRKRPTGPRR